MSLPLSYVIYIQSLYHYTDRRHTDGEVQGAGRCLRGIIDHQVRLISKTLADKLLNH